MYIDNMGNYSSQPLLVVRGLGLEVNFGIIVLLAHRTLSIYPSWGIVQVAQLPLSFVF